MEPITRLPGAPIDKSRYETTPTLSFRDPERMKKPAILTLSIFALTVLAISGCGRKGDPIRPSVAARQQAAGQAEGKFDSKTAPAKPAPANERRFILDGLLD